jgi:hypothetical protein
MSTNANRAYKKGTNLMVEGSLICQSIDKQRNLDRFLSRQQGIKASQQQAQVAKECRTTASVLSADISRHVVEVNRA